MAALKLVVVSGLSGSGKSHALKCFEDVGYFCIDNLPPALLPRFFELCEGTAETSRVALGIDSRVRESLEALPGLLDELRARGHSVEVIFIDAGDEVLVRRFGETRRPHPLAPEGDVAAGIARERERLAPLRQYADRVLDTSALTSHELRRTIRDAFQRDAGSPGFEAAIVSFGFKHGLPSDADVLWDARFLPNPFYVPELRNRTGLDAEVSDFVLAQPEAGRFLDLAAEFLRFAIPLYEREGKTFVTVAIGCTGGRHRSVVLAERLARMVDVPGVRARVRHRDVER